MVGRYFTPVSYTHLDVYKRQTLIDGGRTAHSAFKLPLNLNNSESALCNISKQSGMAQVIREANVIVRDECTMAHKGGIEALNRTCLLYTSRCV